MYDIKFYKIAQRTILFLIKISFSKTMIANRSYLQDMQHPNIIRFKLQNKFCNVYSIRIPLGQLLKKLKYKY